MSIFSGFFSLFSNGTEKTSFGTDVNPATGLPMTSGIGSVDVAGNPYGCDFSSTNSGFDNGFASHDTSSGCVCDFSSGGGSGFGGFGSGSDW